VSDGLGDLVKSASPEMSKATADKIKGAMMKSMPGLAHSPATENPGKFVPHLIEAIGGVRRR
jgi:hypothetical protein